MNDVRKRTAAMTVFHLSILIGMVLFSLHTASCAPTLANQHEMAVETAIAVTNGTGFTLLQMRQNQRLDCVEKNTTREDAEDCIGVVDDKFREPLETTYYFDQALIAWKNAVVLFEDGKLSEGEMLRFALECGKAYLAMSKALKPLGIELPVWQPNVPGGTDESRTSQRYLQSSPGKHRGEKPSWPEAQST